MLGEGLAAAGVDAHGTVKISCCWVFVSGAAGGSEGAEAGGQMAIRCCFASSTAFSDSLRSDPVTMSF